MTVKIKMFSIYGFKIHLYTNLAIPTVFYSTYQHLFLFFMAVQKSIGIALRELSLQKWPSQIQKVVQFNSILNVRHGVMLVGPTAGGKTTVRKLLRHALFINEGVNRGADVAGSQKVWIYTLFSYSTPSGFSRNWFQGRWLIH